jgi:hypothetical protein
MMMVPFVVMALAAAPGPPGPGVDLARLARLVDKPGVEQVSPPTPATEAAEYPVESAGRATSVYVLPAGPKTVRALEIVPTAATAAAWRSARLRLTWEADDPDAALAGVDLPLTLAARAEDRAWVVRLPMPYRSRALLRIDTEAPLEGRIRVRTTRGVDPDAGYLRGAVWETRGRLVSSGRGHLAGFIRGWAERKPVVTRLVADGNEVKPFRVEQQSGPFQAVYSNTMTGEGSWRLHDPVIFREGFSIELAEPRPSGDYVPADTKVAVFWYSDQPRDGRDGR